MRYTHIYIEARPILVDYWAERNIKKLDAATYQAIYIYNYRNISRLYYDIYKCIYGRDLFSIDGWMRKASF